MGTANHRVEVIRIAELEKHPNADSLSIVRIRGYQVVVRTENYKVGDLAVYIQPDSVVPNAPQFAFLWNDTIFPDGQVPEKKRRVTARRFRKEWSEGMLLPVSDFSEVLYYPAVGTDVSKLLGIAHYEPPEDPQQTTGDNENAPGTKQNKRFPRSLKGWLILVVRVLTFGHFDFNGVTGGSGEKAPTDFRPVYDVESVKNYPTVLQEGEEVRVTEKIHGSNARYTFVDGKMYAGSRKLWKAATSSCIWRKVLQQHSWIEEVCRANPGYTLYGEVVPTQGGYDYGCKDGETKFFVFDVLAPNGEWVPTPTALDIITHPCKEFENSLRSYWAPVLHRGSYTESLKSLADGPSTVPGAKHIREGVVIRPIPDRRAYNLGRVQVKVVSNKFLEKESA